MKRLIFILLVSLLFLPDTNAQLWKYKRYQASGYIGISQFFGDVGGYSRGENVIGFKDITLHQTRVSIGGYLKYWVVEDATIKGGLSFTLLHGTDLRGSNEARGFENVTMVIEPIVGGEYYFIRNKARNSYLFMQGRMTTTSLIQMIDVYATAGIGAAIYSVSPNETLELRAEKVSGVTVSVPFGIGATVVMTPNISIGAELILHETMTDYLDGYTSQFSSRNDLFYTLGFTFNYKFKLSRTRFPSGVRH